MGSQFTAAFFVGNLFNEKYYAGGNLTGPNLGIDVANPGQPRMYGAVLRVNL
ncbi:MAG: hypothetical protein QHC40_01045 [Sphingobium sp.]|nr:hypothetical protein [Sphingobium sp.]